MRKFWFFLITLSCSANVFGSLQSSTFSNASPAGIVELVCVDEALAKRTLSRGGVLETKIPGIPDIVLVAAHGLTAEHENCTIVMGETELGVSEVIQGKGGRPIDDWAILTLDGRFDSRVHRLQWFASTSSYWGSAITDKVNIRLVKHSNGESGRACTVRAPAGDLLDSTDRGTILLSDCISIPGMSGAPALVAVDDVPTLVGLNIGTRYNMALNTEEESRANVIRLIDDVIERAIVRAIAVQVNPP